ncbi:MAG: matrixin family metalloprotease [Myxococcales bacterium]|nr:matrixin family metalloprotease [Myxococcales bacterium]
MNRLVDAARLAPRSLARRCLVDAARPHIVARFALVFAGLVATEHDALAYCRSAACDDGTRAGTRCEPPQPTDCGLPLAWAQPCIGFSVQQDASRHVDLATAEALVSQAFNAWDDAACAGGGEPSIEAHNLGPVACDRKEYNQKAGNANIVVFRDEVWPYGGAGNALALATVTFNVENGAIYDADLEINGTAAITTSEALVEFDLASILTHEAGHMLGVSHSPDSMSTMFIEYPPGGLSLRTLEPDDVAAVCAIYPPGTVAPDDCDPTPRHGMSSTCPTAVAPAEPEGCTCALPGEGKSRSSAAFAWLGALAFAAFVVRSRS